MQPSAVLYVHIENLHQEMIHFARAQRRYSSSRARAQAPPRERTPTHPTSVPTSVADSSPTCVALVATRGADTIVATHISAKRARQPAQIHSHRPFAMPPLLESRSMRHFDAAPLCPGGELCACAPFPCAAASLASSTFSCHTLPNLAQMHPLTQIEPDKSSAAIRAHIRSSPSAHKRKLSLSGTRPLRRGATLGAAVLRRHASSTCWAADLVAVAHHALHAEMLQLRTILASVRVRGARRVQDHEVDEVARWWRVFAGFAEAVLDAEESLIAPWARVRSGAAPHADVDAARVSAFEALAAVEATLDLRRHVDRADVLDVLLKDAPEAAARVRTYCAAAAAALVPLIRAHRAPVEAPALDRRVLTALRRGSEGGLRLALLAEWMPPDARDTWVRRHLRPVHRMLYPRWARRYYRDHAAVPVTFQRRLDSFRRFQRRSLNRKQSTDHRPPSPQTPNSTCAPFAVLHPDIDRLSASAVSPDSRDGKDDAVDERDVALAESVCPRLSN